MWQELIASMAIITECDNYYKARRNNCKNAIYVKRLNAK